MFDPTEAPSSFHLRKASMDDFEFAEALTHGNMGGYYQRHHLVWRGDLFLGSWRESENFILEMDGKPIGVLRITQEGDSLHIRDVQIAEGYRRLGAGTYLLDMSHQWARERGLRELQLRVFVDNPAARSISVKATSWRARGLPSSARSVISLGESEPPVGGLTICAARCVRAVRCDRPVHVVALWIVAVSSVFQSMLRASLDKGAWAFAERTPEHRGKGALALIAQLLRDMRQWPSLTQQGDRPRKNRLLPPLRETHAKLLPKQTRDRACTRSYARRPLFE